MGILTASLRYKLGLRECLNYMGMLRSNSQVSLESNVVTSLEPCHEKTWGFFFICKKDADQLPSIHLPLTSPMLAISSLRERLRTHKVFTKDQFI